MLRHFEYCADIVIKERREEAYDLIPLTSAQINIDHYSCRADNRISFMEIFQIIFHKVKPIAFIYIYIITSLIFLWFFLIFLLPIYSFRFHLTHPVCLIFLVYYVCAFISLWSLLTHLCILMQIMGRIQWKIKLNFCHCAAKK